MGLFRWHIGRYGSDHTYIYDLPNGAKNGRACFIFRPFSSDILSRNQCKEDYPFQPKVRCPDPVLFVGMFSADQRVDKSISKGYTKTCVFPKADLTNWWFLSMIFCFFRNWRIMPGFSQRVYLAEMFELMNEPLPEEVQATRATCSVHFCPYILQYVHTYAYITYIYIYIYIHIFIYTYT